MKIFFFKERIRHAVQRIESKDYSSCACLCQPWHDTIVFIYCAMNYAMNSDDKLEVIRHPKKTEGRMV